MRPAPPLTTGSPLTRSVAASLAAILDLDPRGVPVPDADHPEPMTVWSNWLAQRGLGLVPIADPASFGWPGPWLALLRGEHGLVGAVAYGPPSDVAWHPLDGPETFADVETGYVVAPADVALWRPPVREAPEHAGVVEAIVIAPAKEADTVITDRAVVKAGHGIEGDRYFDGEGTFSNTYGRGHDLTLIQAEVLDELGFAPADARRNVVTRGIDLDALVGRHFTVGDIKCFGQRLCEPCAHLERLSPGTLRPLIHRGGLRADVLVDGEIAAGDAIAVAVAVA